MIIVENNRILIPDDLLKIILQIYNISSQIDLLYLFCGIRPSEANFILDHPEAIDYNKRTISFTDKQWNKARRFRDRTIYLSRGDLLNVSNFIKANKRMNPKSYQINRNLKLWASKAKLETSYMDSQTIRATRLAWMLTLFPSHTDKIVQSMDFYGNVDLYKQINFTNNDKLAMLCYLGDWSGVNNY